MPLKPRYLHEIIETKGADIHKLCYLGQILREIKEPTLFNKQPVRLVHELKTNIPPFTRIVRGTITQSDLATSIMNLPLGSDAEKTLVELLAPYFTVSFKD